MAREFSGGMLWRGDVFVLTQRTQRAHRLTPLPGSSQEIVLPVVFKFYAGVEGLQAVAGDVAFGGAAGAGEADDYVASGGAGAFEADLQERGLQAAIAKGGEGAGAEEAGYAIAHG